MQPAGSRQRVLLGPTRFGEPETGEVPNLSTLDVDALGDQQQPLQTFLAAIPAQPAARGDHPMAGYPGPAAAAHDVAHGARGPGPLRQSRDVAVCGHAA